MAAETLLPGDRCMWESSMAAKDISTRLGTLVEPVTVYNFGVLDFHNYFVGLAAVWVHNECRGNWGKGRRSSPRENMQEHYKKHGYGINVNLAEEYTKKATHFANEALSKKIRNVKGYPWNGPTIGIITMVNVLEWFGLARNIF